MKDKPLFCALFILFLITSSCVRISDSSAAFVKPNIFNTLKVGQKNKYIRFLGQEYWDRSSEDIVYLTDTLIVEITGKTGGEYIVSAELTPNSYSMDKLRTRGYMDYWVRDSVGTFRIKEENDTLYIINVGFQPILFALEPFQLPLKYFQNQEIRIIGWKPSLAVCSCSYYGFVRGFVSPISEYSYLNIWVDERPMSYDGFGTLCLYSKAAGVVRYTSVTAWGFHGSGWELLE